MRVSFVKFVALSAIVAILSACAPQKEKSTDDGPSWLMFVEGSGSFDAANSRVTIKKDADVTVFTDRPYHISQTASGIHDLDVFVQTMIDDENPPNASFAFAKNAEDHIGFVAEIVSVTEDNETVTLSVKATEDLDGNLNALPTESFSDVYVVTTIDNWWGSFWKGFKKGFVTTAKWVGAGAACVATPLTGGAAAAGCAAGLVVAVSDTVDEITGK